MHNNFRKGKGVCYYERNRLQNTIMQSSSSAIPDDIQMKDMNIVNFFYIIIYNQRKSEFKELIMICIQQQISVMKKYYTIYPIYM